MLVLFKVLRPLQPFFEAVSRVNNNNTLTNPTIHTPTSILLLQYYNYTTIFIDSSLLLFLDGVGQGWLELVRVE